MKIAIAGTIWLNTPPDNYGGTEHVIYNLANALVKKEHEVTFFGPATAKIAAKIIPTVPRPLREMNIPWVNMTYTLFHLTEVFDRAKEFDIVHIHLNKSQDYMALPFSFYTNSPTLFTLHFPTPNASYKQGGHKILQKYAHLPFNSISKFQQEKELNFVANVYNSIAIQDYPFIQKP